MFIIIGEMKKGLAKFFILSKIKMKLIFLFIFFFSYPTLFGYFLLGFILIEENIITL